jgi:hypothetical protein
MMRSIQSWATYDGAASKDLTKSLQRQKAPVVSLRNFERIREEAFRES